MVSKVREKILLGLSEGDTVDRGDRGKVHV
jgi:hypothetical protein